MSAQPTLTRKEKICHLDPQATSLWLESLLLQKTDPTDTPARGLTESAAVAATTPTRSSRCWRLYEAERTLQRYGVDSAGAAADTWRIGTELLDRIWKNTQNARRVVGLLTRTEAGTGSMTCAGIASLIIAMEKLPEYQPGTPPASKATAVKCCGGTE